MRDEADVLRWLAQEYDLAYTTLEDVEPDRQLLSLFPARILLKEELLPLRRVNGSVEVATSRLFATQGLDALKTMTGLNLKPVLAASEALQREMKKRLGVGADTLGTLGEDASFTVVDDLREEDTDLDSAAEDASIIRFVNQVLRDAIELRASDIHLEPFEEEFRIRYRIDGVLQDVPVPAQIKRFQPAIVSRVKILSHLNIAEKRLPQDGRIKIRIDDAEVDIRVSVIPMLHGEALVLRLLRQNSTLRGMGELGMDTRELESFRHVLQMPHGIILVTGPTGSGKTSTLYTALNEINDCGPEDHHDRGPGGVSTAGRQPDSGLRKGGPDVCARAALDSAPRPGCDSDWGNPRPGDGPDRRAGFADGPPGVLDPAHQRRAGSADPAGGYGRRALPGGLLAGSRAGPAAGARAVQPLQAGRPFARGPGLQGAGGHSRRHDHLPLRGLPGMPPDRVLWPPRHLRMDGLGQRDSAVDSQERFERRDPGRGPPRGMRTLADDGWRLVRMGITTVEEVLSVTTAKEVSQATKNLSAGEAPKEPAPDAAAPSRR